MFVNYVGWLCSVCVGGIGVFGGVWLLVLVVWVDLDTRYRMICGWFMMLVMN